MDKSSKGKRGRNTGDSEVEEGNRKRSNTRGSTTNRTPSPQPGPSTPLVGHDTPSQVSMDHETHPWVQEKKGKKSQYALRAMEILKEIERTGSRPNFLNLDKDSKEGNSQEPSNSSQNEPCLETEDRDPQVSSGQSTQNAPKEIAMKEANEEVESSKELDKAITAIIKAQKTFMGKLGQNLDQARRLLKLIDPKEDNTHLIAELHQHTLHLVAISKWFTCKDFTLPYDWQSYENFCKAEEAIPPNRMRDENQEQVTNDGRITYAVADEILALFKRKLEENIQQIRETKKERERKGGTSCCTREDEEHMEEEEATRETREEEIPLQQNESQSEKTTMPAGEGSNMTVAVKNSTKYIPVKATNIWLCSPNKEPIASLIKKAALVAHLNQAELVEEDEYKLVYGFPSQEKATEVFNLLLNRIEHFTFESKVKPYLGLPSYQGRKGFKIRIENISSRDLKEWWKMIHSEDEDFQSDFISNLVERNSKLFVAHDIRSMESWITKPRGRSGTEKDHVALVLMVGPMTFDRAKKHLSMGHLELTIWPSKDNYKKRVSKYEQKRKEEDSLQKMNHLSWEQIPTSKKRAWLSFYPHICNLCFDTGHQSEECEAENPPSPRPCMKCKELGKKGAQLDHKTNSFSCKWYKNLSNRMEHATLNYQGGY